MFVMSDSNVGVDARDTRRRKDLGFRVFAKLDRPDQLAVGCREQNPSNAAVAGVTVFLSIFFSLSIATQGTLRALKVGYKGLGPLFLFDPKPPLPSYLPLPVLGIQLGTTTTSRTTTIV